jgi:MarR family transcriptional regulator, organic hydroperoxide resistance regulator
MAIPPDQFCRDNYYHDTLSVVRPSAAIVQQNLYRDKDSCGIDRRTGESIMSAAAPLDSQLCFSLYATSMAVNRTYKPLLDRLGITYPQYLVLLALWEGDGRTVGAIAARLGLESSTVTPLAKRLEAAGLVNRTRNPQDERQVQVRLTERGAALREECGCLAGALIERSGMAGKRLAALNKDVRAFCDALTERRP